MREILHAMLRRTLQAIVNTAERLCLTAVYSSATNIGFVLLWTAVCWLNQLDRYDKAAKQIRREDRLGR